MTRQVLAQIIRQQIPLTRAMGLKVKQCSVSRGVRFGLPLKPNRNHKNTAFGGTLVAGQALASWAWLMALLESKKVAAEVVVQRQNSEFLRPVAQDFEISTEPVSHEAVSRFFYALERRGKARIEISATVTVKGKLAATYRGEYVAIADGN